MATNKTPPPFLLAASDTSADNKNDAPRAYRDQLKPETASDILPSIIASYGLPNVDVSYDEVKVIKVFTSSKPRAGSIASLAIKNGNSKALSVTHCMAIPAPKQKKDSNNWFVPLPDETGDNVTDLENKKIIQLSVYCFDNRNLIQNLAVGDTLRVEYVNGRTEAKILEKVAANDVAEVDSQSASAQQASENGNGSTIGDLSSNSTGDLTQNRNNNQISDGKCGDGSSQYPEADCKTAKLDSSGQTITLHPIYWGKINDLLTQIKTETGRTISVGESIRNQQRQFSLRKSRCPAALEKMGEENFKTAPWSTILKNGPCLNDTPVAAIKGPWASNHLKGLAVDFIMDVNCPASNVNLAKYEQCKSTSIVFNLLKKYAPTYGVINLISEPWHWSYNGN